ncbi:MAG TPA: YicC/YloC family endoribonuclease [Gemmatimonadaceae bacterium]|nr:YicC/YloC family endoribonuclease [Gemmatimonadaceae bacterium]
MTGFGSADGTVGKVRVSVEVRTVNHRFFNPSIKLPPAFSAWESEVREALRTAIARGHATVTVRTHRDVSDSTAGIDEARFATYAAHLKELRIRYGLGGELDLATILRMPDVIVSAGSDLDEPGGFPDELLTVLGRALDALTTMRCAEGGRIAEFLRKRIATVEAAVGRLEQRAPQRVIEQRDRLKASVAELTNGVAIDPQRLAQEIAILADRLDVSEELDRFRAHIAAFRDALNGSNEVGKRLGFLAQELLREANTTGSKANDAGMMHDVVEIKEELEKIREQVDNLE